MVLNDITFNVDIPTLIILIIFLVGFIIVFIINKFSNKKLVIEKVNLGLSDSSITLKCTKNTKRIAYKIWIECVTRVVGYKIDLEKDVIRNINSSYYEFFKEIRNILKDIELDNPNKDKELINLTIEFLNEVIRPYTTGLAVKFNTWYDEEIKRSNLEPVEIQKKYNNYNKLVNKLMEVNKSMQYYIEKLEKIAFK